MLTSMRDSVKADIAMTDAQFGLLTSVFLWVYGALSPLGGFIADRFSRKWVIIGSLGVWSAVTWLTGHVHTFEQMFAARALMGVSEAFYIPAGLALIADLHHGATRSRATGMHMSGVYAGAALGGLGGYIAEHYGWRNGFTWFGFAGTGLRGRAVLLPARPARNARRRRSAPSGGLRRRSPSCTHCARCSASRRFWRCWPTSASLRWPTGASTAGCPPTCRSSSTWAKAKPACRPPATSRSPRSSAC